MSKEKRIETGIVKWFNELENYGFITPDVGHQEIFFHRSDLNTLGQAIETGERVEYEISKGPQGWEAKQIRSLSEE
jgi:cold shock protein